MIPVFKEPARLEKDAKEKYSIPPFLMMEHAANAMAAHIRSLNPEKNYQIHIFCGKGNNGADGLALARLLQDDFQITVYCPEIPKTDEGKAQYQIAINLGLTIKADFNDFFSESTSSEKQLLVDCIYGIGFHGELPQNISTLFEKINKLSSIKIACDTPSGLGAKNCFRADYTITMGELKTALFTDQAKACCGQIIVADLGIARKKFEACAKPDAYLITKDDETLPFRKNPAAHKGTYGHTVVFAGEKSGAGIIAATAAIHFGSGLTSLYKTPHSNLEQFKISPELMICDSIPQKTTSIAIGSGLGKIDDDTLLPFIQWFSNANKPSCVIDADLFSYCGIKNLLETLNSISNSKIILTPHLKELQTLLKLLGFGPEFTECPLTELNRIEIGQLFTNQFPNCTLIMKSAVTYIAHKEEIYVCNDGSQSLAKGGSGDILAGMCAALLAQNYDSKTAAITAVEHHALTAYNLGETAFDLSTEKIINNL